MNRGVEIDSDVADGPHSVILPQVTNGVAVRMAVLYLLAGGAPDWAQPAAGRRMSVRPHPDPRRAHHRSVAAASTTIADVLLADGMVAGRRAATSARPRRRAGARRDRARSSRPGLIDVHVHLREPGQEDLETIATGCDGGRGRRIHRGLRDAQHRSRHRQPGGGRLHRAARRSARRRRGCIPIGAISVGQKGEQLAEFGEMVGAGAVAVSDDGKPVVSQSPHAHGARVCPDLRHSGGRSLRGPDASRRAARCTRAWSPPASASRAFPAAAEEIMVARDILLAELTGGHVHLCHMSTRGSVELIRRAKEQGHPGDRGGVPAPLHADPRSGARGTTPTPR